MLTDTPPYREKITSKSAELAAVANVCARPVQSKTVQYTQPVEDWFDGIREGCVTKLIVQGVPLTDRALNDTVELLILPAQSQLQHQNQQQHQRQSQHQPALPLIWPTFREDKQNNALGRHILLVKGEPMVTIPAGNPRISENVIDVLLRGDHIALVGHPGIGKSTELNIILLQLFQSLVDPAQPLKDVFQRAGKVLYHYLLVDGKIVCTEVPGAGKDLDALAFYFKAFKHPETIITGLVPRNDVVLLLEMTEKESDPSVAHIPTVVALSARDVKNSLKTMYKDGSLDFAARPPHTEGELMVLATALFHAGGRAKLCSNLQLPMESSLLDVRRQIKQRIEAIGPLAREVLGSRVVYTGWLDALEKTANVGEFLELRQNVDMYELPSTAKYYVAPLPNAQLMLLGRRSMELILRDAREDNIANIRRMGFEWQLAEAVFLHYYLLGKANSHEGEQVPPGWNFRNWEFFRNPGADRFLQAKHSLPRKEAVALRKEHTKQEHIA